MFVWKASTILNEIFRWLPDISKGLTSISENIGLPEEATAIRKAYKKFPSISIHYGLMEKADNVFVLPASFGWSDVGSWDALWEIFVKDRQGNTSAGGGNVLLEDTKNSLVYSPHKLVALLGVKDLIVVETEDALLICQKGQSQDVKKIVETLEANKLKKYL